MNKVLYVFFLVLSLFGCGGDNSSVEDTVEEHEEFTIDAGDNVEAIENKSVFLTGSLKGKVDSIKWIQVSGKNVHLNNNTSLKASFNAPELTQDEVLVFKLTASDQYSTKEDFVRVNITAPTVSVYVDHASLPTLQQLAIIIDDKNGYENKKFVSWGRVNIPDDIANKLNIVKVSLSGNNTSQELIDLLYDYSLKTNRFKLILFTNTAHATNNIKDIVKLSNERSNVQIGRIELFDDGSAEYIDLYGWKPYLDKAYDLNMAADSFEQYVNGLSNDINTYGVAGRYSLSKNYPVKYHFLRADYLDVEPDLSVLKEFLGGSVSQMKWDYIDNFDEEQKQLFYHSVGLKPEELEAEYNKKDNDNFIFTGTTTWAGGETREFYAQQQINVLKNAVLDSGDLYLGKQYDLFFKGHPAGNDINTMILNGFPEMYDIKSSISFEVLMMAGLLPQKVGGIASSLYFSLPSEKIDFLVFTSSKDVTDREEAMKSSLVQVMLKLNIIKEEQVKFWSDLKDCSSGVCI